MEKREGKLLKMLGNSPQPDDALSSKEVAPLLRCCEPVARKLMRKGQGISRSLPDAIKSHMLGSRRVSLRKDVIDFRNNGFTISQAGDGLSLSVSHSLETEYRRHRAEIARIFAQEKSVG